MRLTRCKCGNRRAAAHTPPRRRNTRSCPTQSTAQEKTPKKTDNQCNHDNSILNLIIQPGPAMDWRPVQALPCLLPDGCWDKLQPPHVSEQDKAVIEIGLYNIWLNNMN